VLTESDASYGPLSGADFSIFLGMIVAALAYFLLSWPARRSARSEPITTALV